MLKLIGKSLLVSPAVFGAALAIATSAQAADTLGTQVSQKNEELLNQVESYSKDGNANDQVTSVSELKDVSPTDWAYEALRSLVERYGCIVGYPDRTFRGNRAATRWEFAAGLNACLNTMERLIQENVAVLREDIEKLKRLMQEFEAELAALGARVDNLESRVAFLEDHQFSTTTKLTGEVIMGVTNQFNGGLGNNQTVFQDRVRLAFNTSFTGTDRLVTRIAAGDSNSFKYNANAPYNGFFTGDSVTANNGNGQPGQTLGYNGTISTNNLNSATSLQTWQNTQTNNTAYIDWVAYYTPVDLGGDFKFSGYFSAYNGKWEDFVPTLNPFFEDFDGGKGSLSTFAQRNPIYRIGGGSGAGISLNLGFLENIVGPSSLSLGYLAGTANNPSEGAGLFNGNYGALGQLNLNIGGSANLGFTYVNAYLKPDAPIFGAGNVDSVFNNQGAGLVGTNAANLSTSALARGLQGGSATSNIFYQNTAGTTPVSGAEQANAANSGSDLAGLGIPQKLGFFDGFGGKSVNAYGAQFSWDIFDGVSFSAYGTYASVRLIGKGGGDIWTYGGGFAFPDLGKEGSLLGIFAGVQPYFGGYNLNNALGFTNPTSLSNPIHVEGFYKYQVTDNISITPGVIWVNRTDQIFGGNQNEIIGTLRGTFSF